jgi:hypothetical protein
VLPRRIPRPDTHSSFTDSERHLILAAETLRSGDSAAKAHPAEKTDEKISVFWRVFGGTILSICALSVISAYQSLANGLHEVRSDLNRSREAAADFIKKDDFNSRQTTLWNSIREAQALSAPVTVLTSKVAGLEDQKRIGDQDHKDLLAASAAIAAMKDKDAALEKFAKGAEAERRDLVREIQQLRERIAKLEGGAEKKPNP